MATVKNITSDVLSLFHKDAPPVHGAGCDRCEEEGCNVVEIRDELFVDRAWPHSTWELVEPPTLEGYADDDTDDAYVFVRREPEPDLVGDDGAVPDLDAMTVAELKDHAALRGIDLGGARSKPDIIAAIAAAGTEES